LGVRALLLQQVEMCKRATGRTRYLFLRTHLIGITKHVDPGVDGNDHCPVVNLKRTPAFAGAYVSHRQERSMFPYYSEHASSITRANLQALLNISGRCASGLQQLTELNVQTVKTVVEETSALFETRENGDDFLGRQTTMLAQFPEKAAAYSRHFFSIVGSTEADLMNETRNRYEQIGISVKEVIEEGFEASMNQVEPTLQSSAQVVADTSEASADATQRTAGLVLNASGEIAQKAMESSAQAVDGTEDATAKLMQAASKAGSKR
jgi:phasin family protein